MAARDNRAASYMNQYDNQYDNGGSYDTGKSNDDMGGCAKCGKHILFAVNFLMLLIGVALIVVVFFVKENGGSGGGLPIILNDTVVWLAVIAGVIIIIVSFLGCVGATTHSKCILVTFAVALCVCLLFELVFIIIIFTDKQLVRNNAEKQWNNWTDDQRSTYETDNSCTGFDDCYASIEQSIKNNMFIVGGVTIGVFVYQLLMTIMACCLCTKSGKGAASVAADDDV
jgi:amino acid transporter